MYVCICRAVTEERVRAAIAGGAESVAEVASACGAGEDCGACHAVIEEMIEEHLDYAADQTSPGRLAARRARTESRTAPAPPRSSSRGRALPEKQLAKATPNRRQAGPIERSAQIR